MMNYIEVLADLKNKNYYPIYFLYGEEAFFIDEISDFIEKNVLDESQKEFDQTILYGKDTDIASIISQAKRFPMLGQYQVVIVKEAQEIKEIEDLISYVKQPLKSTLLVICYKYSKLDQRKQLAKSLSKMAVVFESKKLYDNQIPDWISKQISIRGYAIQPKATLMMSEFLGTDLSKITNEIEKLAINLAKGTEITPSHIEANIGISKDFNVFELQKALGEQNVVKANQIINYFAANQKDNPMPKVVALLYIFFSRTLIYHQLIRENDAKKARAIGVSPNFLKDYKLAARNFTVEKLSRIISSLREYDLKSKGLNNVTATDGELMKEMIFKILH